MKDHPSPADLEIFLRGISSPDVDREVVCHLLACCSACRARLHAMGWTRERLDRLVSAMTTGFDEFEAITAEGGYSYEEAFLSAWMACRQEFKTGSSRRDLHFEEEVDLEEDGFQVEDLPLGAEDLVPEPSVVDLLLNRSYAVRYQDPRKMLRWARFARLMAERCDEASAGGHAALADLRARAWGQLGNALRVAGRLRESADALNRAQAYYDEGTGDRVLRVHLLNWRACLSTYQRQFAEAVSLLDEAAEISQALGERLEWARCLVNKAIATIYSGQPESAVAMLDKAIPLIGSADPRLLFAAHHDLIVCYLEAGRLKEALALVPQARSLGEDLKDELLTLRILWQEGRILSELGLLEQAEAQFVRSREGFIERDLSYPAALVSLDLTAVYIKLGLTVQVRRTIADVLPIFGSIHLGRELLASLIQLQQASDQTNALQLIRTLSWELRAGPKLHPSD